MIRILVFTSDAGQGINQVVFSLAAILPNTELERKQKEYGIVRGEIPTVWMTPVNEISTQDRLTHLAELKELARQLNMQIGDGNNLTISIAQEEVTV